MFFQSLGLISRLIVLNEMIVKGIMSAYAAIPNKLMPLNKPNK